MAYGRLQTENDHVPKAMAYCKRQSLECERKNDHFPAGMVISKWKLVFCNLKTATSQ